MSADRHSEGSEGKQRRTSAQGGGHDGRLHSSRGSNAGGADLAAFVPLVEPVVRRSLAKRRLSPTAIDDVMQEVWARGLRYGVECESARQCYRWATVVAHRIATEQLRRQARLADDPVPDAVVPDAADYAESRLTIATLRGAFARLSARDRALILEAARGASRGATKRERDRFALRLMRARDRLRTLMDRMTIVFVGLRLRARDDRGVVFGAAAVAGASVVAMTASHLPGVFAEDARPSMSSPAGVAEVRADGAVLPSADHAAGASAHGTGLASAISAGAGAGERRTRRPPPVDVPWYVEPQQVELRPPTHELWTEVETEEPQPDDHMLCVGNIPVLGTSCYDEPEL